jgi:hypothetical protein
MHGFDRHRIVWIAMETPASFAHSLLDALTASIAVIDGRGFIIAVNKAWRDHAKAHHPNPDLVCEGADYLGVCDSGQGPEAVQAAAFAAELRAMIRGERDSCKPAPTQFSAIVSSRFDPSRTRLDAGVSRWDKGEGV